MNNLPNDEPQQILTDIIHAIAEKYNAGEKGIDLDNFAERIQAYGDTRELEGRTCKDCGKQLKCDECERLWQT